METTPILDLPEALKRAMGDAQFLRKLIDELRKTLPDFITRLNEARQKGDMSALGREAHQLKGAAANMSAKAVAAAAAKLEQIEKSGNAEDLEQAMNELELAAEGFKRYVAQIDWTAVENN